MSKPYDMSKRGKISKIMMKEGEHIRRKLDADAVFIIAVFRDGEHMHAIDVQIGEGFDFISVYQGMITAHTLMRENPSKDDISIS